MNRSDFFKKLGLGVLAVAVAPKILAEVKEGPKISYATKRTNWGITGDKHETDDYDDITDYLKMRGCRLK